MTISWSGRVMHAIVYEHCGMCEVVAETTSNKVQRMLIYGMYGTFQGKGLS